MELDAKSQGEQAPLKTSLASTKTNGTDLNEHQSSEERHEHKDGHEHGHKHNHRGHHAHHAHHAQNLQDGQDTNNKEDSHEVQTADEQEEQDAEETDDDESSCYGNDSRCKGSTETECDLLEDEGADCRWLGEQSSGGSGASADERSMAVAIHILLAAFASSAI